MKNIKEPLYWIVFVIYEEILFSTLIFGKIPSTIAWISMLSLPLAIILNIITSIFAKKVNVVLTYILTVGMCFVVGAQLIYYKIYEAMISFYSFMNGGQVAEFWTTIVEKIGQNWQGTLLFYL